MRTAETIVSTPVDREEWRLDGVDEHLVSLLDPTSIEADQYRTLRHVVEHDNDATSKKVIAITSAVAGDGKTTTALNLAGTLARAPEARILAVDLDLRTRSLGNRLGLIKQSPGLVDLILDPDLALDDVVRQHPRFRLSILPAGPVLTVPYELLKSPRMRDTLDVARQRYDYVVLDTPPLLIPDFRLVGDLVDGFIIVVSAHRTPRKFLEDALNQVDSAKLIGIAFVGDDHPISRYLGYYSRYYRSYRTDGRDGGSRRWISTLTRVWHSFLG